MRKSLHWLPTQGFPLGQELCECVTGGNWCHHWLPPPCSDGSSAAQIQGQDWLLFTVGTNTQPRSSTLESWESQELATDLLSLSEQLPSTQISRKVKLLSSPASLPIPPPAQSFSGGTGMADCLQSLNIDLLQDIAAENGNCQCSLAAKTTQNSAFTLGSCGRWELLLGC